MGVRVGSPQLVIVHVAATPPPPSPQPSSSCSSSALVLLLPPPPLCSASSALFHLVWPGVYAPPIPFSLYLGRAVVACGHDAAVVLLLKGGGPKVDDLDGGGGGPAATAPAAAAVAGVGEVGWGVPGTRGGCWEGALDVWGRTRPCKHNAAHRRPDLKRPMMNPSGARFD